MHTHDKSRKHINKSPEHIFDTVLCVFLFLGLNTHFQLIFNFFFSRFYLFPSVFTYSQSILPIFDCVYLFSTIFTQIWVLLLIWLFFFNCFHSFPTIFDYFSSPSLTFHHLQPLQLIFNHSYWFLTIFVVFIYF